MSSAARIRGLLAMLLVVVGCRGSTTLHTDHAAWSHDAQAVPVYFLRPEHEFRGVMGRPISIDLAGEELLELARGDYTVARLQPGRYEMVVENWGVEGPNNSLVLVETPYDLDLSGPGPTYLLFHPEELDFGKAFGEAMAQRLLTVSASTTRGNTTLTLSIGYRRSPDAFVVRPVDREAARELVAQLTSVGAALEADGAPRKD